MATCRSAAESVAQVVEAVLSVTAGYAVQEFTATLEKPEMSDSELQVGVTMRPTPCGMRVAQLGFRVQPITQLIGIFCAGVLGGA